jgi:hypothetical protein
MIRLYTKHGFELMPTKQKTKEVKITAPADFEGPIGQGTFQILSHDGKIVLCWELDAAFAYRLSKEMGTKAMFADPDVISKETEAGKVLWHKVEAMKRKMAKTKK